VSDCKFSCPPSMCEQTELGISSRARGNESRCVFL
jgi:hypothetical protein